MSIRWIASRPSLPSSWRIPEFRSIPGERVRYMIKDAQSKEKDERVRPFPLVGPDDTYDAKEYQKMLLKATEELLIHFGYDVKRLEAIVNPSPSDVKRKKSAPPFEKGRRGGILQTLFPNLK